MAGAACKVIINMIIQALVRSLEVILTNPSIHQNKIPNEDRLELIQRLANIDLAIFSGDTSLLTPGGLNGIVASLQEYGLVTDEVWLILREPVIVEDKPSKGKKE